MGFVNRYSGKLKIRLAWDDREDRYSCKISGPDRTSSRDGFNTSVEYVTVGAPAVLTKAVDSPEAYDDAARAAIAFLNDTSLQELAALGDSGYLVTRKSE